VRLPFVDSVDKAYQAVRQINHAAEVDGKRPLVFTTVVNMDVLAVLRGMQGHADGHVRHLHRTAGAELGIKSNHRVGRFSDASKSKEYHDRIEAINFTLDARRRPDAQDLEGPT
jgi:[pyruvate, water dikinase]-phosphate phosphotransferase / [pyruvate, water dikinase] kinase